jgi:hypothetical protein
VLTVAFFSAVVAATGWVACGVSGCSGAGFGPSFAPEQAQLGLLLAGFSWAPLTISLLAHRRLTARAAAAAVAVLAGVVLAGTILGLGPNGCPWGHARAVAGPEAFAPGTLTCSAVRDGK